MKFNDYMVVGESINNPGKVIKKINNRKPVLNHFLVFDNNGHLEIYSSLQFMQKNLVNLNMELVAIFKEQSEAIEFIRKLCDISMKRFGEPDLIKAIPFYHEEVM